MPTKIEAYVPNAKTWVNVEKIEPGTYDRSLPHLVEEGAKLIVFSCAADDSETTIFRSKAVYPEAVARVSETFPDRDDFKVVKKLNPGESAIYNLNTDRKSKHRIRITHLPK